MLHQQGHNDNNHWIFYTISKYLGEYIANIFETGMAVFRFRFTYFQSCYLSFCKKSLEKPRK